MIDIRSLNSTNFWANILYLTNKEPVMLEFVKKNTLD